MKVRKGHVIVTNHVCLYDLEGISLEAAIAELRDGAKGLIDPEFVVTGGGWDESESLSIVGYRKQTPAELARTKARAEKAKAAAKAKKEREQLERRERVEREARALGLID